MEHKPQYEKKNYSYKQSCFSFKLSDISVSIALLFAATVWSGKKMCRTLARIPTKAGAPKASVVVCNENTSECNEFLLVDVYAIKYYKRFFGKKIPESDNENKYKNK
jgi:hypothetical protein